MVGAFLVRARRVIVEWVIGARRMILDALVQARAALASGSLARETGQTTAEYALVILAAAAVALVLLAWAKSSGKLPDFFDKIIDNLSGSVS